MIRSIMSKFYCVLLALFVAACSATPEAAPPPPRPAGPAATDEKAVPEATPSDDRPVILAFGDSLTAGYGLPRGQGYPEQLQQALDGKGYRYRVVNAGISGDTTSGGRARLEVGLRNKPAIVILELGANDGLRGLPTDRTHDNLEEMIVAFDKAGAKVVLAGMTLPRNYGVDYVRSFENVFPDLAKKYDATLIPFFLEGVAADYSLNLGDGIHPNEKGYRIVVENLLRYLEPLLKKD
jgi:acyl-CoA thioesterase-1